MITLYDNPFSPFARKVRMVLDFKGLSYRSVDALSLDQLDDLERVNVRAEVPALVDGGVTVVESADIVAYLEDRHPTPALLPSSSLKPLGIVLGEENLPRVHAWFLRMREQPVVRDDLAYVKRAAVEKFVEKPSPYEGEKVIWRGDRVEWLLCNGFDAWWAAERASGRAIVPSSVEHLLEASGAAGQSASP